MRHFLLAAALLCASSSYAERVARKGDAEVRIFDSPCVSAETIARIPEKDRKGWGKAIGVFGGQKFFGCWQKMGEDTYVLWEDGDIGVIPAADLKEALGA